MTQGHFTEIVFLVERELPAGRKSQEQGEHAQDLASVAEQLRPEDKRDWQDLLLSGLTGNMSPTVFSAKSRNLGFFLKQRRH